MKPVPLMQIEGLRVDFGHRVRAVRDVDLEVYEGETLGLVGESGCGKSTLGKAMLRVIEPSAGTIRYLGLDITGLRGAVLRQTRAELQMVFQDPFGSLNPRRKVADIVAEPLLRARRADRATARRAADELLDLVGLGRSAGERRPHEFSGGQRQRIGIARALAPHPQFVVADEPVSALDVSVQAQIINLLADLTRDRGLTMLFISHDLGVVRHVADRIAVMYLGRIIEVAGRDAFFAAPAHPYSEALLSAVPALSPQPARERIVVQGEPPDPADPPPGCAYHTRCRYAAERCRTEEPALQGIRAGRQVRCHFPLLTVQEGPLR